MRGAHSDKRVMILYLHAAGLDGRIQEPRIVRLFRQLPLCGGSRLDSSPILSIPNACIIPSQPLDPPPFLAQRSLRPYSLVPVVWTLADVDCWTLF